MKTSELIRSRRLLQAKTRAHEVRDKEIRRMYLSGDYTMAEISTIAGFVGHQRVQQILSRMGVLRAAQRLKTYEKAKK